MILNGDWVDEWWYWCGADIAQKGMLFMFLLVFSWWVPLFTCISLLECAISLNTIMMIMMECAHRFCLRLAWNDSWWTLG